MSEETRQQWLAAAKARNQSATSPHAPAAPPVPVPAAAPAVTAQAESCPVDEGTRLKWLASQQDKSASSSHPPSSPFAASASSSSRPTGGRPPAASLSTDREVSSIPRVSTADLPQLSEHADTKAFYTPEQSHWVYPSEEQFYSAMERKNHNPSAVDMKTLVPIHNAVNEEAWKAVLEWEKGLGGDECGGVKLRTFKGTPGALTPKSFANRFLFGCVLSSEHLLAGKSATESSRLVLLVAATRRRLTLIGGRSRAAELRSSTSSTSTPDETQTLASTSTSDLRSEAGKGGRRALRPRRMERPRVERLQHRRWLSLRRSEADR